METTTSTTAWWPSQKGVRSALGHHTVVEAPIACSLGLLAFLARDIPVAFAGRGVETEAATTPPNQIMKKLTAFGLLGLVLGINMGCEQQSYEETRMFNQSNKATGHGHEAKHEAGKPGEARVSGHKEVKE
jgi:hypothetical protein